MIEHICDRLKKASSDGNQLDGARTLMREANQYIVALENELDGALAYRREQWDEIDQLKRQLTELEESTKRMRNIDVAIPLSDLTHEQNYGGHHNEGFCRACADLYVILNEAWGIPFVPLYFNPEDPI